MQEQEAIKEARAQLKFARISARKVKIVADLVRGKNEKIYYFNNNNMCRFDNY